MITMSRLTSTFTLCASLVLLTACGGESTSDSSTSSGSSASGAPSSIIGWKLVQRVVTNDGKSTTIKPGNSVTYSFIDARTILGAGLNTLPTTSWTYSASGSSAIARLNYSVGYSIERLTFSSATSGTYRSESTLNSGTTG